jgi:hypothetical protein
MHGGCTVIFTGNKRTRESTGARSSKYFVCHACNLGMLVRSRSIRGRDKHDDQRCAFVEESIRDGASTNHIICIHIVKMADEDVTTVILGWLEVLKIQDLFYMPPNPESRSPSSRQSHQYPAPTSSTPPPT